MTKGSADTILRELYKTEYGEHVIVIHPRIATTLSKTYSHYAKTQLVNNNEIVLLLPLIY